MNKRYFSCITILSLCIALVSTQNSMRYPIIQNLTMSDPIFKQYIKEVTENYKVIAQENPVVVNLYAYTPSDTDDLLAVAARCNIPYISIALLNNIYSVDSQIAGQTLILPASPGIFIAENPDTPLEFLLKTRYSNTDSYVQYVIEEARYAFIPSGYIDSTERAFFLDPSMVSPLDVGIISSSFGMRLSPISGRESFHGGTDIAAPMGTPVFACKSGIIAYTDKNDAVYGNYIIIQHDNNTQSFYAHLSTILTKKGNIVGKGEKIGTVGSTGMSTGPHLHFEIKIGGIAQNPSTLIKNFMQ